MRFFYFARPSILGAFPTPANFKRSLTHAELNDPAPLTGFAQTRLTWASLVQSPAEIPSNYRAAFNALPNRTGAFPYTVRTPSYAGFIHRENEKLVCWLDETLYVIEPNGNRITTTRYARNDIHAIEFGKILLQAWLTIRGVAGDGALQTTTLKFNTVTDYLFAPFIDQFRNAPPNSAAQPNPERAQFDYLSNLNFKFMNLGRSSILPNEHVIAILLQPELLATASFLDRFFHRVITPAHLSILTDRELVLIRDEIANPHNASVNRYGGIWNYVPLCAITSVALAETDRALGLSIHLSAHDQLDVLFAPANREAFGDFVNQIERARRAQTATLN